MMQGHEGALSSPCNTDTITAVRLQYPSPCGSAFNVVCEWRMSSHLPNFKRPYKCSLERSPLPAF